MDNMNVDVNEMLKKFPVGDCVVPDNIEELPKLAMPNHKFVAPRTVDLRDYCTPTSNQGSKPHCAGHAAAAYAENILWRKNDYYEDIDPDMVYYAAKKIDGCQGGLESGTTLTAVLQVLLDKGYFDKEKCEIKVIWKYDDFENMLKYAIHKFGCCLFAINCTEEAFLLNANKTSITGKTHTRKCGGHALCAVGYNQDGLIFINSWGEEWGMFGFGLITWEALKDQFLYAALLDNCLYDMRVKYPRA